MVEINQGRWTAQVEGDFWKRVGRSGRCGIWDETHLVRAGEYGAIYGKMPPFGLRKATRLERIGSASSARTRLRNPAR